MRQRPGFRWWAIVWAVLQFALPAAATYADARLEREGASGPGAHVESRSDASCRPVHPAECALCQVVSRASAPAAHDALCPVAIAVVASRVVAEQPWRPLVGAARRSLARAPPAA